MERKIFTWSLQKNLGKQSWKLNAWLRKSSLFAETEGFVIAIQDQVIATRNYQKHIEKKDIGDSCRLCHHMPETIQHITSSCSILANSDYLHRHNTAVKIVHQHLATTYKLLDNKRKYFKYYPSLKMKMRNSTRIQQLSQIVKLNQQTWYSSPR